jgi:hypothetical protein
VVNRVPSISRYISISGSGQENVVFLVVNRVPSISRYISISGFKNHGLE